LKARAYLVAWRYAPRLPEPLLRGLGNLAADVVWLKHGKGIRRLESNYARICPDLSVSEIRKLSRKGFRSYLRYFREAFTLPAVSPEQLQARVRAVGSEHVTEALAKHGIPVAALGHAGNWDLAGAWAALYLVPVLTVAEKLKPEEVYQAFVEFREGLGIEVLGLGDAGVFSKLVAGAQAGGRIIPLLADRDLTYRGVEVELCGQQARVAAGPAAVALAAQVPLLLATIHYERLRGSRRKAAGTPWGIVITFEPIWAPTSQNGTTNRGDRTQQIQEITQAWVSRFGKFLKNHLEDWHMLQSVFVADLEATRYADTVRMAQSQIADSTGV